MKPELLMPAGDLEKAKIAYQFGADACYGSTSAFSMRTREIGFTYKTLKEAINYAHSIDKRFYITCNIYPHQLEISKVKKHIKKLISMRPDALIVADPGILMIAKQEIEKLKKQEKKGAIAIRQKAEKQSNNLTIKQFNNIEIHLSTQANTTNSESIKFWHKFGVKRFILARELSLKEITEIRKNIPKTAVLEAFVHGAMCNSVSGRCNLSNYLSYRDANRGACVQACRWKYALVEEKRPNQFIPVEEDQNGSYIYNSKDLKMIEHLDKLKKAGVKSFKVEGRNKSIYYCAIVARAYRKAIDNINSEVRTKNNELRKLKKELESVTNRGYSTGFYFGHPKKEDINYKTSRPSSNWQFVGIVKKKLSANKYLIECRNEIKKDSWIDIVTPDKIYRKKLTKFMTLKNKALSKVNPNDKFILKTKHSIPTNSMLRAKKANPVNTD